MKYNLKKIFVICSILFLSSMIIIYGYRLFYFYNKENKVNKLVTLTDKITSSESLINSEKSIVKENDTYYFSGKNPNNYLYYSGLMYRILYLDKTNIYAITDEEVTKLPFGENSNFQNSNIYNWLNSSTKNTGVYFKNLKNTKYNLTDDNISLLNKNVYQKIGGSKSYVVKDDFWILDNNDSALVLDNNGQVSKTSTYSSFLGVRPVIKIKGSNTYINGDGSLKNPYILEVKKENSLSDLYVGDYLEYNNIKLRIIEKNSSSVRVLCLNKTSSNSIFSYNNNEFNSINYELGYYLNSKFLNNLENKDIIKTSWYNGNYNLDYRDVYSSEIKEYVGVLKIGDYFIGSIKNSFTMTPSNDLIYTVNNAGDLYINEIQTKLDIYPVFNLNSNLKIEKGKGLETNPYVVGD